MKESEGVGCNFVRNSQQSNKKGRNGRFKIRALTFGYNENTKMPTHII